MPLCGALKCGECWIPKPYEEIGGCPRFTCIMECQFCHGSWKWEIKNERSNKWIDESHFLLESWKWSDAYRRICAIGREGNCWCRVQHGWVGGFGMGYENPLWFKFEWRANGGMWVTNQHQ